MFSTQGHYINIYKVKAKYTRGLNCIVLNDIIDNIYDETLILCVGSIAQKLLSVASSQIKGSRSTFPYSYFKKANKFFKYQYIFPTLTYLTYNNQKQRLGRKTITQIQNTDPVEN